MRNILSYILLLLLPGAAISNDVDTLIGELESSENDSIRIELLDQICYKSVIRDTATYYKYSNQLLLLSKTTGSNKGLAKYYINHSIRFAVSADFDGSDSLLGIVDELYQNDESLFNEQARALRIIGLNNIRKGNYQLAMEKLLLATNICSKYQLNEYLAKNYISLGILFTETKDFAKAISYYQKTEKLLGNDEDDTDTKSMLYNNISTAYLHLKDTVNSLNYLNKAIDIDLEQQDFKGLSIEYQNMGSILYEQQRYPEALTWFEKALELKYKFDHDIGIGIARNNIGETEAQLGRFNNAIANVNQAIKIFDSTGTNSELLKSYRIIEQIYRQMGNYKNAYKYKTLWSTLNDSLNSVEIEKNMNELSNRLQLLEQQRENDLLKTESERQTYIIIITGLAALVVFILLIVFIFRHRSQSMLNKALVEKQNKIEKQNTELHELNATKDRFFSIISHDLKSPMSSQNQLIQLLHSDLDVLSPAELKEFIQLLHESSENVYSLLENLLTWGRTQLDTVQFTPVWIEATTVVSETLGHLRSPATLKEIELINKCSPDNKVFADISMLSTLVRNITNNSIKFTRAGGSVSISDRKVQNGTEIIITDTGIGMDRETVDKLFKIDQASSTPGTSNEKGTGLGLIICREFIDKHGGDIQVSSQPGVGSEFVLFFPAPPES